MTTFSESWHRVCDVRARLRPQVRVHRQHFRGERWFVLHDPFNNQFFRLTPSSYDFVSRLEGTRTVQQAWQEALQMDPDGAPGQQDVIELLAQLYSSHLIYADLPADTVSLFERQKKRRRHEMTSKWLNAMFARLPLWDPDDFLRRCLPFANLVLNRWGAVVWLLAVTAGVKVALDHGSAIAAQSREVLEPANLLLLYAATVAIKLLHEMGHAIFCRKFGGEVHTLGVMLMVFTPMPFVDATSAWSFRQRWQRMLVGAGGMIVELFIAALAAFIWAGTSPGLVNTLAFNVMFAASILTVLFNINPLLRFDGYYLLTDWLGLANLYQRSLQYLRYLSERYLFGLRREKSPATNPRERWWLAGYGLCGGAYRLVLFSSMTLFVSNQFLLLGAILAVFCVMAWAIVPLGRFLIYLSSSPRLQRNRLRAVGMTLGGVCVILLFLAGVPFPSPVRAVGAVQADEHTLVATATPGVVERVLAPSGLRVRAQQPLLRLTDLQLAFELRTVQAQLQEASARQRQSMSLNGANLRTIQGMQEALRQHEAELLRRQQVLTVAAAHDGWWSAPRLNDHVGRWFPRGAILGEIVNPAKFVFVAQVPTRDALQLVSGNATAEVRLLGQSGPRLEALRWQLVAAAAETRESEISEEKGSPQASKNGISQENQVFEVRAELDGSSGAVRLLHGQTGVIRFSLPWEPLLSQWSRRIRQLFQHRPG